MSTAAAIEDFTDELKPGTKLLRGQYTIVRFLNAGGFGQTYLARDSLDRTVVIKECFPGTLCSRSHLLVRARSRSHQDEFKLIVRLFMKEAQRLAKVRHPNIVGVHQVFEDNDTAYMVLDFIEGDDLLAIMENASQGFGAQQIREMLKKLLHAIACVHENSLLHRDISPDNILLDKFGNPILIDFGAARESATRASRALSALQVVKDGYSPQEFYLAGGNQGPHSDIYALGATFYHLLVGEAPPHSQLRLAALASKQADPYLPLAGRISGYDDGFLAAIDKAMAVFPQDRHQSAEEWLERIEQGAPSEAAPPAPQRDAKLELSISKFVEEANKAILEEIKRDALKEQLAEDTPEPSPKKEPYFAWQLEDDWLRDGEEEDRAHDTFEDESTGDEVLNDRTPRHEATALRGLFFRIIGRMFGLRVRS
jgi:serine/threonine protein kinase